MDNKPANIYQEDSGRASINSLSTRKKLPIKIVSFVIVFLILALLVEVIFYLNDRTKKASIREKSETLLNENDSVTNNFITDLSQDSKHGFLKGKLVDYNQDEKYLKILCDDGVERVFVFSEDTIFVLVSNPQEEVGSESSRPVHNKISKDVFFQSIHVGIPIQINLLIKGTDDYIINTAKIFNESSK